MRPFLALNCLLQIEQERSEEDCSVGDALALTLLHTFLLSFAGSFCFIFSSTPSYEASTLLDPVPSVPMIVGMLKSLREALRVSLYRFF